MKKPLARVYIAGTEVFDPQAQVFFDKVRAMCELLNFEALCPFDPAIDPADANAIYAHNLILLERATAMVVDISPFRGSQPDAGSIWEDGYAAAKGLPIVAYTRDMRTEGDKQAAHFIALGWGELVEWNAVLRSDGGLLPDGKFRNTHASPVNLMVKKSAVEVVKGDIADALMALKAYLDTAALSEK